MLGELGPRILVARFLHDFLVKEFVFVEMVQESFNGSGTEALKCSGSQNYSRKWHFDGDFYIILSCKGSSHSKKKKCELSHFWSGPPPKKCKTYDILFTQ